MDAIFYLAIFFAAVWMYFGRVAHNCVDKSKYVKACQQANLAFIMMEVCVGTYALIRFLGG